MRVACVSVPNFYVQMERSGRRLPAGPLVIGGSPFDTAPVVDCSAEAEAKGVRRAMLLSEAYHLCPEAAFLPLKGEHGAAWGEVLHDLGSFALRIESPEAGLAYLEITRSARLYGGEERLAGALVRLLSGRSLAGRVGVGNSRFLARQAARKASPVLVVAKGAERAFASPLPVWELPFDDEVKERLALLGLTTLGRLSALSLRDLCSQFGIFGIPMWEMATAADEKRRIPKMPPKAAVEREAALDAPLETAGRIACAIEACLEAACAELEETGRSCRRIGVVLSLQSGRRIDCALMMKAPTQSVKAMLERVVAHLPALSIESAVRSMGLSLSDLSRAGEQEPLFGAKAGRHKKLEGATSYLKERYREPALFRVEEGEKDSRLPERRYVFREA